MQLSANARKAISIIIKLGVLAMAFVFSYKTLAHNDNAADFRKLVTEPLMSRAGCVLVAVFALLFLNGTLQAANRKRLVRDIRNMHAAIPPVDLPDVGVRGKKTTYFFNYVTHRDIAVQAIAAYTWLVNLIIPAILGAGCVLKPRFF